MNILNKLKSLSLGTVLATLCLGLVLLPTIGCTNQVTTATLVSTLGNTVAAVETIEGNTALATQITTDTQAAATVITNWVPGTATQNIDEAINLVINDLKLLPVPVSSTDSALIALAASTAKELLADFTTPTAAGAVFGAKPVTVSSKQITKLHEDFKSHAKSIISHDPTRSSITIQ